MPLTPFGETVLFKLPKVPEMPGDFRDRHEQGIFLGSTLRTGEYLVGCPSGVYTVSSCNRCSEDLRWSMEMMRQVRGTPREPTPGSGSHRLVAYAKKREQAPQKQPEFAPRADWTQEPEVRPFKITKVNIEEHGRTEGCPGCRAAMNPGSTFRANTHTSLPKSI